MPFTSFYDQALLAYGQGVASYTPDTTFYLALSTTLPTQAGSATTGAPPWNFTEPSAQVQLTTALASGTAYTNLGVSPLDAAVASGDSIKVSSTAGTQNFSASAGAAIGATSIPITSATSTYAQPIGALVQDTTQSPGYARVSSANTSASWSPLVPEPAAGYELQNSVPLNFPASNGSWNSGASISYFGVFNSAGGGNLHFFGTLTPPETVSAAGTTLSFPPGALTTTLS